MDHEVDRNAEEGRVDVDRVEGDREVEREEAEVERDVEEKLQYEFNAVFLSGSF